MRIDVTQNHANLPLEQNLRVSSSPAEACTFCCSCVMLQDPIDGSSAVLVKKWDITSEKQTELQLEASQEALQR